jgi:hypothetical protein
MLVMILFEHGRHGIFLLQCHSFLGSQYFLSTEYTEKSGKHEIVA